MEFLETFGCIWSSKEVIKVIIGRAVHGSDLTGATPRSRYDTPSERLGQSDTPMSHAFSSLGGTRATLPERRGEVVRVFIARRHESDLTRATRRSRSRFHRSETRERPGATSRSVPSRSLTKPGATSRSDYYRSMCAFCLLDFMFTQGPFGHFIMHVFTF
ncbi:hypothetical protein F2Q69_00034434 [Brassica cretica]|uniref:Uncharacterized protein n=1 Tax=Brassica cretica TaxID=69181 RepID=A0A8S9SN78_BRACR|nr:hypothetical protein F2Q69_00034434 [Brassica cretica]